MHDKPIYDCMSDMMWQNQVKSWKNFKGSLDSMSDDIFTHETKVQKDPLYWHAQEACSNKRQQKAGQKALK